MLLGNEKFQRAHFTIESNGCVSIKNIVKQLHKLKSTVKVLTVLLRRVVKMARVHVIDSVFKEYPSKWKLCFQWCLYDYENGKSDKGFRFIWKTPEGKLQAARGQARIPDIDAIHELTEQAKKLVGLTKAMKNNLG